MGVRRFRSLFSLRRMLAFCAVLICGAILATIYHNVSAEGNLAEINPSDWRLEAFFLDPEIDSGQTPIQNAVWNTGEVMSYDWVNHVITLQINYHNNNVSRTYAPGELEIRVPNFLATEKAENASVGIQEIKVGADATGTSDASALYDWYYNSDTYQNDGYFAFTNRTPFEDQTNAEGSIQITFNLESREYTDVEAFEEYVTQGFTETGIKATLNNNNQAVSNEVSFQFSRTSHYYWQRSYAQVILEPEKIYSYRGLGENPENYTWVKWKYHTNETRGARLNERMRGTFIGYSNYKISSSSFDGDEKIVERDENIAITRDDGVLIFTSPSGRRSGYFYAGYPKDQYNEELDTNVVTESIDLDVIFSDQTDWSHAYTWVSTVDLSEYAFDYSGDIVGI